MAAARTATRLSRAGPLSNPLRRPAVQCQALRALTRRTYASNGAPKSSSNTTLFVSLGAVALGGGGLYYAYSNGLLDGSAGKAKEAKEAVKQSSVGKAAGTFTPKQADYQEVYDEVAKRLVEHDDYDDGSYGPVILRLGWHASGTYDVATGTGGSNGATMRFAPEGDHGANAGLKAAR